VLKRAAMAVVVGIAIYLVFPAITEVLVDSSQAVLAYRLASYWAPLCAGPIAYGVFRMRYRGRRSPPQAAAVAQT
jgi:hypothetical protein